MRRFRQPAWKERIRKQQEKGLVLVSSMFDKYLDETRTASLTAIKFVNAKISSPSFES